MASKGDPPLHKLFGIMVLNNLSSTSFSFVTDMLNLINVINFVCDRDIMSYFTKWFLTNSMRNLN